MNILHTIISFNIGGAEKLIVDILNNWNDTDEIVLCIINNDYTEEMINRIKKRSNVKIEFLHREKGKNQIKILKTYLGIIKKYRIEIIHCHDKESLLITSISKFLKWKIGIFSTIHDTGIYPTLGRKYVFIDQIITRKIIAISKSVQNEIIERGIKKKKVKIIRNGIDFSIFNLKKKKRKKFTIGCVARIQLKKKGQDILIKAIALVKEKYPEIECYFAGTYEEKDRRDYEEIMNIIEVYNLNDNIKFLGNVNNIPNFLKKLDLFVLPSRREGFGLVIVEAMAAKVPIIATNIEGPREIIKNEEYGLLFESENYRELARKIIYRIENNEDKLDEIYKYARENYDIDKIIMNLKQIYLKK